MLQQSNNSATIIINGYQNNCLTINQQPYQANLVISPDEIFLDRLPDSYTALSTEHIKQLCALKPEVLLLGTGEKMQLPCLKLMQTAHEQSLSLEFMDTYAACRTFTVLSSEGRKVIAALFL